MLFCGIWVHTGPPIRLAGRRDDKDDTGSVGDTNGGRQAEATKHPEIDDLGKDQNFEIADWEEEPDNEDPRVCTAADTTRPNTTSTLSSTEGIAWQAFATPETFANGKGIGGGIVPEHNSRRSKERIQKLCYLFSSAGVPVANSEKKKFHSRAKHSVDVTTIYPLPRPK